MKKIVHKKRMEKEPFEETKDILSWFPYARYYWWLLIEWLNKITLDLNASWRRSQSFYFNMEVIICGDQVLQQPVSEMFQVLFFQGKIRLGIVLAVWSTDGGSQLNRGQYTSLGLLGGGGKQLVSNSISDVFVSIFEGWSCVKAREGWDGVVEMIVAFIMRHSEVKFLRAH